MTGVMKGHRSWRGWVWRTAKFGSLAVLLVVVGALVSSALWEITVPVARDYRAGTRGGCLKVFVDANAGWWSGSAWGISRRMGEMSWGGRWQYSPKVGWVMVPMWLLVIPAAFVAGIV